MATIHDDLDQRYLDLRTQVGRLEQQLAAFDAPQMGRDFLAKVEGVGLSHPDSLEAYISLLREAAEKRTAWLSENRAALLTSTNFTNTNHLLGGLFFQEGSHLERLEDQLVQLFSPLAAELAAHQGLMEKYHACSQRLAFARRCLDDFNQRMESDPSSLSGDWTYVITIHNKGFTPQNGVRGNFNQAVKSMVAEIRGTFRMDAIDFPLGESALQHPSDDWTDIYGHEFRMNFPQAKNLGDPVLKVEVDDKGTTLSMNINVNHRDLTYVAENLVGLARQVLDTTHFLSREGYLIVSEEAERPVANLGVYSALQKAFLPLGGQVVNYDQATHNKYGFKLRV